MILKHVPDTQIFKSHETKVVHQFTAFLMSKVLASIGNALMNMLYSFAAFCSFGCSLLSLREFALCFRKFLFIPSKKVWIFNLDPVGQCSKTFKPNINTNSQFIRWQRFRIYFTREAGIPISNGERIVPYTCTHCKSGIHAFW